ncbi:hypothetical protein GEMRC1_011099 [Eukaryota sp. GEM-RC1]
MPYFYHQTFWFDDVTAVTHSRLNWTGGYIDLVFSQDISIFISSVPVQYSFQSSSNMLPFTILSLSSISLYLEHGSPTVAFEVCLTNSQCLNYSAIIFDLPSYSGVFPSPDYGYPSQGISLEVIGFNFGSFITNYTQILTFDNNANISVGVVPAFWNNSRIVFDIPPGYGGYHYFKIVVGECSQIFEFFYQAPEIFQYFPFELFENTTNIDIFIHGSSFTVPEIGQISISSNLSVSFQITFFNHTFFSLKLLSIPYLPRPITPQFLNISLATPSGNTSFSLPIQRGPPLCLTPCVFGKCVADDVCDCDYGWKGFDCSSIDVAVVCPTNCTNNGICTPSGCDCYSDYTGIECQHYIPYLHCLDTCVGGICSELGDCNCDDDHFGDWCEFEKFDCSLCQSNTTVDCDPYSDCSCLKYWGGEFCQTATSKCAFCPVNSYCDEPTETCICFEGFKGQNCDVTYCIDHCSHNGLCRDGQCVCFVSWKGSKCDVIDCTFDCVNGGQCVNGKCVCPDGYSGLNCADSSVDCPINSDCGRLLFQMSDETVLHNQKLLPRRRVRFYKSLPETLFSFNFFLTASSMVTSSSQSEAGITFSSSPIILSVSSSETDLQVANVQQEFKQPFHLELPCEFLIDYPNFYCYFSVKNLSVSGSLYFTFFSFSDVSFVFSNISLLTECPFNCHGHGFCLDSICQCFTGFTGTFCEYSLCSKDCQHGGTCIGIDTCKCVWYMMGTFCQVNVIFISAVCVFFVAVAIMYWSSVRRDKNLKKVSSQKLEMFKTIRQVQIPVYDF